MDYKEIAKVMAIAIGITTFALLFLIIPASYAIATFITSVAMQWVVTYLAAIVVAVVVILLAFKVVK